jgi:hypothetical protein
MVDRPDQGGFDSGFSDGFRRSQKYYGALSLTFAGILYHVGLAPEYPTWRSSGPR